MPAHGGEITKSAFTAGRQPSGEAPRKAIRFRDSLVVVLAPATVRAAILVPLAAVVVCSLPATLNHAASDSRAR
jgi:hypothetical protein